MPITVMLEASPALMSALNNFVMLLGQASTVPLQSADTPTRAAEIAVAELSAESIGNVNQPAPIINAKPLDGDTVGLEQIITKAKELSKSGFKHDIRALLDDHFATSVSALEASRYPDFYQSLIELENSLQNKVIDEIKF